MPSESQARRIEVLLAWRDEAMAAGHPVPSTADLMRIGTSGDVITAGIDGSAVWPWRATLTYLLRQLRFMPDPLPSLPDDLRVPETRGTSVTSSTLAPRPPEPEVVSPVSPRHGDGQADPLLLALREWWRAERREQPGISIKDMVFVNIVRTKSRTETDIRRQLPQPAHALAGQIAAVVDRYSSTAPVEAPPLTTTPPAEPATREDLATSRQPDSMSTQSSPLPPDQGQDPLSPSVPSLVDPQPDDPPLDELDLADHYPTDQDLEQGAAALVTARPSTDGTGLTLTWPKVDAERSAPVVLYRVVSEDGRFAPDAPQDGEHLTLTQDCTCIDDRPFRAPVRHLSVWVHAGPDLRTAAASAPILHAAGASIARPRDAYFSEDEAGGVFGQWTVPRGVETVQVFRVPKESWRPRRTPDARYRIRRDDPNLGGFVDLEAESGSQFFYAACVVAEIDGEQRLSTPVWQAIEVSATLGAVTDLVVADEDPDFLDLSWTPPPLGTVRIYITKDPPSAGADKQEVVSGGLPSVGLPDSGRVRRPINGNVDRDHMQRVPWPRDWTRAYVTPVTMIDERALVGRHYPAVRLGRVTNGTIVERTFHQVAVFDWPPGASAVLAYVGFPGQAAEDALHGRATQDISHDQYRQQGGLHFASRLPSKGCSVHLLPVTYRAGRRIDGRSVALDYSGLMLLQYRLDLERDRGGHVTAAVRIVAEVDNPSAPAFALVHNADRLPLHLDDGRKLLVAPVGGYADSGPQASFRPRALVKDPAQTQVWSADVTGLNGYLRVFADLGPEMLARVALLDPPLNHLVLKPQASPR
ncbi:hypothetical protein [Actinomycetospora sp. CA-084318]|uniref:hypothetical protein n=1 Tax=Actinomycetospora sp. CA-084318 TaxID=3239892 RepID=UPI003D9967BA